MLNSISHLKMRTKSIVLFLTLVSSVLALSINGKIYHLFERLPDELFQDILVYTKSFLMTESTLLVGKLLHRMIGALKKFINGRSFDSTEFESRALFIAENLSIIREWSEKTNSSLRRYSDQLSYAQTMFQTMNESASLIKHYSLYNTEHQLVRLIAQTNVGLFSFLDSHGEPDPTSSKFGELLSRFQSNVVFWRRQLAEVRNVSVEVLGVLKTQFQKAERVLKYIALHDSAKL